MEDSGVLNITNPSHMFALHFVFLLRINQALQEYLQAFNHHKIRIAQNWSPYQMWINNMMNPDNPLSDGQPDQLPEDEQFYGYDPEGPSPFENSDNVVVVPPVNMENDDVIQSEHLQIIDHLMPSTQMGVDIYEEVLHLLATPTD